MKTPEIEWQIKMRRIRAQQESDFLASVHKPFLQKFIDSVDISLGIRHWKLRWQYRLIKIQGEYIRRNKPERVVYVAKLGEDRRWKQYRHEYIVHTFFGAYEFAEFEHKITGEISCVDGFPVYTKQLNNNKNNKQL
jgi:hypothetical protein